MKRTILHISKYYYPDLGGIESVVKQLCEGFQSYRNIVLCYNTGRYDVVSDLNGVTIYRVGVFATIMSQPLSTNYYQKYRQLIKEYKPEAVHVHCPNPFAYPMVLHHTPKQTKVVLHWHSDIHEKGLMYKLIKPIESAILRRADLVLATSVNYIQGSECLLSVKEKTAVLQNGISSTDFDKRQGDDAFIEEIYKLYKDKTILFFLGRLVPYKGVDKLIEAEPLIRNDVQIFIAGEGYYGPHLRSLAEGNDRIKFLGRLSEDEVRRYLWAADIFTFSSITKAEAFGVALAEAMYCECTPVVFHIEGSGVNWLSLKNETGEEVELDNVKEYAEAIDHLIDNPELCKKYAANSRERVIKNFTEKEVVRRAQEIYDSLLS